MIVFRVLRRSALHTAALVGLAAACGWLAAAPATAEEFRRGFEDDTPSWRVTFAAAGVKHQVRRQDSDVHGGTRAESILLRTSEDGVVRIDHELPACRAIDEFEVRLWVKCDRPGFVLAVRLTCSDALDPETRQPLTTTLTGDTYTDVGKWQELTCRTTDRAIRDRLQPLRAKYRQAIDPRQLVVDRVVLGSRLSPGTLELVVDDLAAGPIVQTDKGEDAVRPAQREEESLPFAAEFRLDRLQLEGRPFFPRLIPYHEETPEQLRQLGVNVAWVPDWRDSDLIGRLKEEGIWSTAIPPRPTAGPETDPLDASRVGLVPFGAETAEIIFWMLGTRVDGRAREHMVNWVTQVQAADRRFRRPIAADVVSEERLFSRHVDMLGVSRHVLQTTTSLREYHDWLTQQKSEARPGTFLWTWTQAEHGPQWDPFASPEAVYHLEPEQLRMQCYAALTSGTRGIGFWTTEAFDDSPLSRERSLAIRLVNLELLLLEPWLATCNPLPRETFEVESKATAPDRQLSIPFAQQGPTDRQAKLRARDSKIKSAQRRPHELVASVLRSEYGTLVVPMWLEDFSQYVPAQAAGNNATMVVGGVPDSASAYEITPTGIRNLEHVRVTGGTKVIIPKFDQSAVILLTADRALVAQLTERAAALQKAYAECCVELTRLKLERVRGIDTQLQQLGVGQPDSPQILGSAKLYADQASAALRRGDFQSAREASQAALQLARVLQRAHWDQAVGPLSSPVSSPYTVCFQTLPAHWKMVGRLGRSRSNSEPNRFPEGDFEDMERLLTGNWRHEQQAVEGVRSTATLYPDAHAGQHSLHLGSQVEPGHEEKLRLNGTLISWQSPTVPAEPDQIAYISGWVKIPKAIAHSSDGLLIFDSLGGRGTSIRLREAQGWTRFELIRPIREATDLSVSFHLTGIGNVLVDDLSIVLIDPPPVTLTNATAEPSPPVSVRPGRRPAPGRR